MSDFGAPVPPPPGSNPPPPPPAPPAFGTGAYGQGPNGPGHGAPGYPPAPVLGHQPDKPPRPPVALGSWLLLLGALAVGAGAFLTWYTVAGDALNGFDIDRLVDSFGDEDETSTNGGGLIFMALVLAGFAITGLFARRVLAVAILAVIFSSLTLLFVGGALADGADVKDIVEAFDEEFSWGPGLGVALVGSLLALAGSIVTLATRRRWRSAGS